MFVICYNVSNQLGTVTSVSYLHTQLLIVVSYMYFLSSIADEHNVVKVEAFVTLIMFNKQIWPCYILCVCVCSAPSLRSDGGRWMVICRSIATTSVCQEVSFIFTKSSTRTRVYMSVRLTTPKAKTDTKCICLWRVRVTWPYEHTAMRHYWEEQYHMHTKHQK